MYSVNSVNLYEVEKMKHTLFDISKVQAVFRTIPNIVRETRRTQLTTYDLREIVENQCGQTSQGEIIVAMLLHGYKARFGFPNRPLKIRCEFNAAFIK